MKITLTKPDGKQVVIDNIIEVIVEADRLNVEMPAQPARYDLSERAICFRAVDPTIKWTGPELVIG